eukprot:604165-Lingulodinium_polyedra.AAC.1
MEADSCCNGSRHNMCTKPETNTSNVLNNSWLPLVPCDRDSWHAMLAGLKTTCGAPYCFS